MRHILKCPDCGSYGISIDCACGGRRLEPKPAKFNPEDKYGHYRRIARLNNEIKKDTDEEIINDDEKPIDTSDKDLV